MRVLVCGDRNWIDYDLIASRLDKLMTEVDREDDGPCLTVIQGCARGADSLAGEWVDRNLVYYEGNAVQQKFPADWKQYGRAAGPIRNQQMLREGKPDLVLAFHDDIENSKGTKDMVNRAKRAGILTKVISHKGEA
jgi:hypothetical protein